MPRTIFLLLMVGCTLAFPQTQAGTGSKPVLIELFTSEGCSSCPPADKWLQQMDQNQPLPTGQMIVLSEHVDYWDDQGWKDQYSSHDFTERQTDYVGRLHLQTPYTPQLIVDGANELHLENAKQVGGALQKAAESPKIPVRIASLNVKPTVVEAHVEADGESLQRDAHVFVAIALDHVESQVLRGENSGRRLTHVAVVEKLDRVGTIKRQKTFSRDVQVKIKNGIDSANLRVIAFVQEPGPGKVLGATMRKP